MRMKSLAGPAALALGLSMLSAGRARGDNLDAALIKNAPQVMQYLRGHDCRNVGVLKFRVRKAGHPASFKVGPINDNMVERLENALIAVDSTASPIGVVRNASRVAEQHKLPKYDTPAGQKALFGIKYPRAWDGAQVAPDLMLTGIISVRADLKSATVQIEAFGADWPKQEKVAAFTVATDRALLTDLNESFRVSSRSLRRKTRAIELDDEAVASAADTTTTGTTTARPEGGDAQPATANGGDAQPVATANADAQPAPSSLLHYEIRYDGQRQVVSADPASPKEFVVAEPKEGQEITFSVRSLASERIGLVLMVNGKSTLYEEDGDPSHCKAWVLDPGKAYGISGFQMDNNARKPFRVLSDQDSASVAYGPNTGLIQFHIMRSSSGSAAVADSGGGAGTATGGDAASKDQDGAAADQPANVSLRGLSRSLTAKSRSLPDLQKVVRAHARTSRLKKRGLIMGNDSTVAGSIENDEVKDQVLVESIGVRYYKPKGQ